MNERLNVLLVYWSLLSVCKLVSASVALRMALYKSDYYYYYYYYY